jgi:multicomponent Na+:H+ antiporter subunit A
MILVDILVCIAMLLAAGAAIQQKNLLSAVMLVAFVSLTASYLFLRMDAPDVAMIEAAVGAGLSTMIFLIAIRRTEDTEK